MKYPRIIKSAAKAATASAASVTAENQTAVIPDVPRKSATKNKEQTGIPPEIGVNTNMDNRQCIAILNEMAKNGNAEAQCALGLLHYQCKGVVKWNPKKAVTLWSLAAEAGNAYAHYNLYCAYGSGRYFPREPEKAMKHLHEAAKNGCIQAMRSLGVAYFCGSCIPKDNGKAMKWIQLHAGKDLAKESLFLASPLYMDTEVSEKDVWPTSSKLRATETPQTGFEGASSGDSDHQVA
jgi:TPR repeat protein